MRIFPTTIIISVTAGPTPLPPDIPSKGSIKKHRPFGTVFFCGTYKMQRLFWEREGTLEKSNHKRTDAPILRALSAAGLPILPPRAGEYEGASGNGEECPGPLWDGQERRREGGWGGFPNPEGRWGPDRRLHW